MDNRRITLSNDIPGSHHVLTIEDVHSEDFDTYTCTATNGQGSSDAKITITGQSQVITGHLTSKDMIKASDVSLSDNRQGSDLLRR